MRLTLKTWNMTMNIEYPNPLTTMLRVMLSLPLAIAWMLMYVIITLGWGLKEGERFIDKWNEFVCDDDPPSGTAPVTDTMHVQV